MNRFQNGFDSYQQAILALEKRSEDEFKLKAVIIHFHHAIEVLLKYILGEKSKCLIYRDINAWTDAAFSKKLGGQQDQKGHAEYTISFDETIKRAMVICDESIDEYAYHAFSNLNSLRNALTHDEIELKPDVVEQLVVTLTPIVTAILQKHLTGQEKESFDTFVTSQEYRKILRQLIGNNAAWRITTVSNLLELYSHKEYDHLSPIELRHLEWTLSLLNVVAVSEGDFYNIDDKYYLTYISYLKQEICRLLICHIKRLQDDEGIKDVIKRTKVIEDIVRQYLGHAALHVWSLLDEQESVSFDSEEAVHRILDNNSFVNNHDIFVLLGCMEQIAQVLAVMTGKKREKLLKDICFDESNKTSVGTVYFTLLRWFEQNCWFHSISESTLDETAQVELESDRVFEEIAQEIEDVSLYRDLIGEYSLWGTIDRIDYIAVDRLETVVYSEDRLSLVYHVLLSVETYFDHDYYDNGEEDCFVEVVGHMEGHRFVVDEAEYLGTAIGLSFIKFD